MIRFSPDESEVGRRVDAVVAARSGVSRGVVQQALLGGALTVSGRSVRPSHRLAEGEVVVGEVATIADRPPGAESIPVEVIYDDDRVVVVSKASGMVTHPAGGHGSGTVVNALLGLGVDPAAGDPARPGIVHRLDRETSGALLAAKDATAHAFLVDAMKSRRIRRTYITLVRGRPRAGSGTVEAPIGRHPRRRTRMAVVPSGRAAVTHFEVLDATAEAALLLVRLETGRTHQIRVHLSHIGHPVVGDRTYGGGASELARAIGSQRPFLHAWRLAFPHPDDGRVVEVVAPVPDDLRAAAARAGVTLPQD